MVEKLVFLQRQFAPPNSCDTSSALVKRFGQCTAFNTPFGQVQIRKNGTSFKTRTPAVARKNFGSKLNRNSRLVAAEFSWDLMGKFCTQKYPPLREYPGNFKFVKLFIDGYLCLMFLLVWTVCSTKFLFKCCLIKYCVVAIIV